MRGAIIATHALQILFTLPVIAMSAALRVKFYRTTPWLSYVFFTASSSFVVSIVLIVLRAINSPKRPGPVLPLNIASTVICSIWSVFWLAAVGASAAQGILGDVIGTGYVTGYTAYSSYFQGTTEFPEFYQASGDVARLAKADWAFMFLMLLLWLIALIMSSIATCGCCCRRKPVIAKQPDAAAVWSSPEQGLPGQGPIRHGQSVPQYHGQYNGPPQHAAGPRGQFSPAPLQPGSSVAEYRPPPV